MRDRKKRIVYKAYKFYGKFYNITARKPMVFRPWGEWC